MKPTVYQLPDQRILFAGPGLGGDAFMSFWQKPGQGMHRLKSKHLPIRATLEEAQTDLDSYAAKHHLTSVSDVSSCISRAEL